MKKENPYLTRRLFLVSGKGDPGPGLYEMPIIHRSEFEAIEFFMSIHPKAYNVKVRQKTVYLFPVPEISGVHIVKLPENERAATAS